MTDGISINVATNAISALLGAGGLAGVLAALGKFRKSRKDCSACPEHQRLEAEIAKLREHDAEQNALLKSIDRRLEQMTQILMQKGLNP